MAHRVVGAHSCAPLQRHHAAAKSDADKNRLARAIKVTDKRIDALVYELYGLTAEEIKIVEGS